MFEETGFSYPWAPIEDQLSEAPIQCRDAMQEGKFPSETASIFSRIEDRRKLLARLMTRSTSWERDLGNMLGGVSFLEFGGGDPRLAAAFGGKPGERVQIGSAANPWNELETKAIPFIDPIMIDALYDDDVDGDDVRMTPTYRDLRPWLWNDVDEIKVAQWHHDLTGMPLWGGSWMQYQISAGELEEDDVSDICVVKRRLQVVREKRVKLFGIEMLYPPHQLSLFRGE
jgi:hypothetical protein